MTARSHLILLPEAVKNRRAISCTKAINPEESPDAREWILRNVVRDQHEGLRTAEVGHIVRGWSGILNLPGTEAVVPAILTCIVSKAQHHNDSWFMLASNELGIPEAVLRDYAAHGDSLSLAILIHVTRQQFSYLRKSTWPWRGFSTILREVLKYKIRYLNYSTSSVGSGIASSAQRKMTQIGRGRAMSFLFYF